MSVSYQGSGDDASMGSNESRGGNFLLLETEKLGPSNGSENSEDPTRARWMAEMGRKKQNKSKEGTPKGFGSFYERKPYMYSMAEFMAEQGAADRIRTADLTPADKADREIADDDSMKESDWFDRTSINPFMWRAQKNAEKELRKKRDETNKKFKRAA